MDLVSIFGTTFGDSQFKQLTVVAAFALLVTTTITCWAVTERVLISGRDGDVPPAKGLMILRQIFTAATNLPPRIQAICNIQLWSWIGWFPFLFYSTTFVGEIYFRYDAPQDFKTSKDALGDIGRIGSFSLVLFSFVTLIGAWLLPLLIRSPDQESFTQRPPAAIAAIATKVNKYKPDLLTAWIWGHCLFSCTMIMAPFAHSFRFATFLVTMCGFPWVLSSWAPSTFLGIEVNRLGSSPASYRRLSNPQSPSIVLSPITPTTPSTSSLLRLEHGPHPDSAPSTGELSGLYFGILNIYTTIPQFIGTFISMIVFSILEPGKSPELAHNADPSEHHSIDGPNAISVCLFIGAISMVGAAFATKRLRDLIRDVRG